MRYRYLFEQMVRRELRQKYKGSALGVLWYVLNPLVLMAAYTVMFSLVLKSATIADYPLFLLVGIVVWTFFSQSLLASASSLLDQAGLIRKVRFPRETIPASVVTVQLVTFLVLIVLLTPIVVAIRGTLTPALALLPALVVALFAFVLGLSFVVAPLHAHFRDVAPILGAALLPWFFVTPIFFDPTHFPGIQSHAWLEPLLRWVNPVAPFIEAIRSVIYQGAVPAAPTLAYVFAAALLALGLGRLVFARLSAELAVVL